MPQIYTGKGYQAPRSPGYAMQALSQFARQDQGRKTMEIQKGAKDRQNFLDMVKLDPVYLAISEDQERMAESMEKFTDKTTAMYKGSLGSLTTMDLAKLQQDKAVLMSEMQYRKGINDAIIKAQEMVKMYPNKWSQQKLDEEIAEYRATGTHDGNFLFPAYQPISGIFGSDTSMGDIPYGTETIKENGYENVYKVPIDNERINDASRQEYAVQRYRNDDMVAYQTNTEYEYVPEKQQKAYDQQAQEMGLESGIEAYVAEQGVKHLWRGTRQPWRSRTPARAPAPRAGEYNTRVSGGRILVGNRDIAGPQQDVMSIDGILDNAMVFNPKNAQRVPVPSAAFQWDDGMTSSENSVNAVPTAATAETTYWRVDKEGLSKIRFTKDAMEVLVASGKLTKESLVKNSKGEYKIKDDVQQDLVIRTKTNETASLIDAWTGNFFSKEIGKLPAIQNKEQSNPYGL